MTTKAIICRFPDRVTKRIDENGNATGYRYDAVGNLTEVISTDGSIVTYRYDFMRKQTRIEQYRLIDPELAGAQGGFEKISTTYAYDKRGFISSENMIRSEQSEKQRGAY